MTPARFIRTLLLLLALATVGWSFFTVGARAVGRWKDARLRPIHLTIMHWGDPAEDKIVAGLCAQYEREHPKVRITRINTGGVGDFGNKLKTMLSAGEPPDVFYIPPGILPELATLGLIAKLDNRVAKEPKASIDDFYPIVFNAFRYDIPTNLVGRGDLYALPKDFTTAVYYINVDLFEKAGVDWRAIQKTGWTWTEFEDIAQKIKALNAAPGYTGPPIYGTLFEIWPDTLRNILWTYGGDFFANDTKGETDFNRVALDSPGSQQALEMIARMRIKDRTAFNATGIAKDGGQEFTAGRVGSLGPVGRWKVPTYTKEVSFHWDVLPVPSATTRVSQIYYTGWSMATASKTPDDAYDLLRYLAGREGQVFTARAGLAIPALRSVAESDDFLNPPPPKDAGVGGDKPIPKINSQAFLDAIAISRVQQSPRAQEWGGIVEEETNLAIRDGSKSPAEAAAAVSKRWADELASPLKNTPAKPVPWGWVALIVIGGGGLIFALLFLKARREKLGAIDRASERAGWAFVLPWIIGFTCLTLGPMIVSLLLSFARWTGMTPLGHAELVGVANFRQLLLHDSTFYQSLKVTGYFVLLGVPVSQLAALAVAMLMNSSVKGITIFRTIYFVPSVISGVAMAVLWLQLFNNDYGLINQVLRILLAPIGLNLLIAAVILLAVAAFVWRGVSRRRAVDAAAGVAPGILLGAGVAFLVVAIILLAKGMVGPLPPNWFGTDNTVYPAVIDAKRWAIPAFVIMGLWGVGGGMIIYLAGLKGIPASLYEAARIDGAGPGRRFWNVTLPMLSPLIFYNLVMGIIGSFQVFTQAYTMTGAGPENSTLFYVLQLYRHAFEFHNMGYASAMAWVLFVIVLLLTLVVFKGSKSLVYYEGLK